MLAGYSLDLRERVVDAVEKGASRRGVIWRGKRTPFEG